MNELVVEMIWLAVAAAMLTVAVIFAAHSYALMAVYLIFMALAILGLTHRGEGRD